MGQEFLKRDYWSGFKQFEVLRATRKEPQLRLLDDY